MTDPDDPSRLLDSPAIPTGLRDVLRNASADVGTDAQLTRLAGRLGPLLGPAAPAVPAAAVSKALSIKLGLAGAALIVAGGGAWLLSATPSSPPPPAPASVSSPEPPTPAPPAPAKAPDPAPSEAQTADAASPTPVVASTPAKPAEKPAPPVQLSEAELLEQARAALRSDPGRALQRANEHAARFPRGVLVQEREVMAIQALRKLGRGAEADRRAEAFAKAFPGSAFNRQLAAPR